MRWLPRKNLTPNHESTKGSQVQHGGQRMEHDGAIPDGWYHARYIICVLCVVLCKLYTVYIQNTYVDTCIKYIYIHIYIYIISISHIPSKEYTNSDHFFNYYAAAHCSTRNGGVPDMHRGIGGFT